MEPWFPRKPRVVAVEQAALLARTAALQAASATARAQHRIAASESPAGHEDPHVGIFANEESAPTAQAGASFADLDEPVFRPGQPN